MSSVTPDFSQSATVPTSRKEMLTVDRSEAMTRIRINSSSLSLIQACPRKAYYALNQKWQARTTSPALTFGSGIHAALEVFYSHSSRERTIPHNFAQQALLVAHGHEAPEAHFLYDAITAFAKVAEPLRMLPETDKRSIATGVWILGHYFKTYLHDTYVTYCDDQGPVTERTFNMPLLEGRAGDEDFSVELFGTIDLVLRNEVTDEVLPADHKTSSTLGNDFFNRIKPNHQYTGYLMGARHALGLETENFLVNGIQVKSQPLTSRGSPPAFTRQITRRTQEDFIEFCHVVEFAVQTYLRCDQADQWPLGPVDACAMWGNCSFLDICSAPNSLRQNILESKFTK